MNEFDQFVKHVLKVKYYARYTDDFVIIGHTTSFLQELLPKLRAFLSTKLKLELHPDKVNITKYTKGIDFLGYVIFPHHRLLRAKTKRRIIRKMRKNIKAYRDGILSNNSLKASLQSYLGVLSHADAYKFTQSFINQF